MYDVGTLKVSTAASLEFVAVMWTRP